MTDEQIHEAIAEGIRRALGIGNGWIELAITHGVAQAFDVHAEAMATALADGIETILEKVTDQVARSIAVDIIQTYTDETDDGPNLRSV